MHRQMRESMLRQTMHVHLRVASDTQTIHFFIGPNDVMRYDVTKRPAFCRDQTSCR